MVFGQSLQYFWGAGNEKLLKLSMLVLTILVKFVIFRFAASALDYDDTTTAIDYLQKALRIMQTGKE
jgi:hypothetical protein